MTKSDIIDFYFIFGLDGLYDRQQMLGKPPTKHV